jgi:NADH:ubiquinone oxidoreductase subunit 3 (subunit A)
MAMQQHNHPWFSVQCYVLFLLATLHSTVGTKHTFTTKHDARSFIGPIGAPFGFLTGGVYNLTVFDFELAVKQKTKDSNDEEMQGLPFWEHGRHALEFVEAGFLLKRFNSEAEFTKYYETVMEQPNLCVYESHRSEDYVSIDPSNIDDDALDEDDEFQVKYDENSYGKHHVKNARTGGIYLSMNQPENSWKPHTASVSYSFTHSEEEGLYFLIFQLCPRDVDTKGVEIRASYELDLHLKNYDTYGNASYLTAGEMKLPFVYFYFSISYGMCLFLWACNIRNIRLGRDPIFTSPGRIASRPTVHAIHHLMTLLLGLKTVTVLFEALRYHFIRIHGHAEFLSAVYFTMNFIRGIFLFTVILLIGSGWSLVKPVLGDKEKKVIWIVLVLQVIDNIAVAVLSQETEGEKLYEDWSALLHLVDILCCCAVLIPIVWQVNSLEAIVEKDTESSNPGEDYKGESSAITDVESEVVSGDGGENDVAGAARTLQKLKQFQRFYILVVVYIYFTRIVVYLFATMLGYRTMWIRYFITELGTLVFYAFVGILFRPMEDNPYLEAKGTESELVEIEFL